MGTTANKLIAFFQIVKRVEGRIKLQKIIYLLQQKGLDFDLNYKYALYGPFSQDLQLQIDFLIDIGFLVEEKAEHNYTYAINDSFDSKVFANSELQSYKPQIDLLLKKESQILEVTSTIYFLKNKKYGSESAIKEKVGLLKPNLIDKIDEAFRLYHTLESPTFNINS